VRKTISTHFAKPKLEQKKLILCEKFQSAKIHCNCIQKQRSAKKKPLDFPQEKTSSQSKNSGDPKKNENP
jgi:hypothetical protein